MDTKERLMQFLAAEVWSGIVLPVEDIPKMPKELAKEYVFLAKELTRNKVLANEMNRLKNAAGENLMRHTKTEAEIAWNRGVLHALESLEKRIDFVTKMEIK